MPVYEYECPKCEVFEIIQSINDDKLETCPTCNSPIKKLISQTTFQLKGGGWYSDGYNSSGKVKSRAPKENTGVTIKHPIIKDRNTGKTLSGPDTSLMKKA